MRLNWKTFVGRVADKAFSGVRPTDNEFNGYNQ